jgi:hypothetical protein
MAARSCSRKKGPEEHAVPDEARVEETQGGDETASPSSDTAEGAGPRKRAAAKPKRRTKRRKRKTREELIETALERIRKQLGNESKELTPAVVGMIEKLLKLDRELIHRDDIPQEIRVLWQETDEESPTDP